MFDRPLGSVDSYFAEPPMVEYYGLKVILVSAFCYSSAALKVYRFSTLPSVASFPFAMGPDLIPISLIPAEFFLSLSGEATDALRGAVNSSVVR